MIKVTIEDLNDGDTKEYTFEDGLVVVGIDNAKLEAQEDGIKTDLSLTFHVEGRESALLASITKLPTELFHEIHKMLSEKGKALANLMLASETARAIKEATGHASADSDDETPLSNRL